MIHKLALVGEPPEHRDWEPRLPVIAPQIHPTADVGAFATIDGGLERPTKVGDRSFVMKHVHVGHDATIGADCELAPGVVVGGHCEIGDRVRIGVNACLRPFIQVGEGARIGAGAVVVKDVPPGVVVAGNPAKPLR